MANNAITATSESNICFSLDEVCGNLFIVISSCPYNIFTTCSHSVGLAVRVSKVAQYYLCFVSTYICVYLHM